MGSPYNYSSEQYKCHGFPYEIQNKILVRYFST